MSNDDRTRQSELWGLFLLFALIALIVIFTFPTFPNTKYPLTPGLNPLTMKEVKEMGTRDKEHEYLVTQVREDLKIYPDFSIEIFIGPYQYITGEGVMVSLLNPPGIIVLLDEGLYQILLPEERIAVIAHELGHLTNENMLTINNNIMLQFQIEADNYSTKYADPEAMISVLEKIRSRRGGLKPPDYDPRIANLERIKLLKQGQ